MKSKMALRHLTFLFLLEWNIGTCLLGNAAHSYIPFLTIAMYNIISAALVIIMN